MTVADLHVAADVALGWLLARAGWLVVEQGVIRPFAAALGRRAYRRIDAATGDRLPDLPS